MSFAVSSSASLAAGSAFLGEAASLRVSARRGSGASGRGGPVQTQAFFGMGAQKQPAGVAMVCRDCGYIYRGQDFNDLPKDYKCPPCGSGKNAFRPEKKQDFVKDGFNASGVRQAKKDNQAAFRAKRAASRKAAEAAEKAARKGGAAAKPKKGGFFGR
jgi:rubredoxin|tara:strand:+ start:2474 stop:2947 length:474 start_codon:yes stop_codon:yes gene_type:complete|mmetsp:Transcript_5217/g.14031  ORF Transcript_5217/g.14031 Transcript_5217/m.14031 type:complete len:158 (-) Transcript_5217:152-625(-)